MNPKILIIDDEEYILEMLKDVLNESGYKMVSTATGFQSVIADITEKSFDLIFCDIMLGDTTGIDFLQELKNRNINIPLILMTGFPEIETAITAVRLGAFDYIRKPFKIKSLLETTQKALAKRSEMEIKKKTEAEDKIRFDHIIKTYQKHLQKIQEQIDSATEIYQDLLNLNTRHLSVNICWKHLPLAGLGGDFIDIRETDDIVDIIIADVAGHDMGSSYHTILMKAFFEENCHKGNDGNTLFQLLNQHLIEQGGNERMITAVFLRIHLKQMKMEIVSAAHPWIVLTKTNSFRPVRLLETGGDVLGIYENPDFISREFELEHGDRIFVCTDGVVNASRLDIKSGLRNKLKTSEFDDIFIQHHGLPLEETVSEIWGDVLKFCENKPKDDMLFMGLEIPQQF
ncbi:fused response regulator/phosphatase [Desulfobacterales bacterium HSG17]|nr:fused response regulator/phosphatase [Desulfobacterales bacterium HSG17]